MKPFEMGYAFQKQPTDGRHWLMKLVKQMHGPILDKPLLLSTAYQPLRKLTAVHVGENRKANQDVRFRIVNVMD